MTFAHQMEIGSDDDDLVIDAIYDLPSIAVNLGDLDEMDAHPGDDHYEYFAEALKVFDIYTHPTDEVIYFVEKKGN